MKKRGKSVESCGRSYLKIQGAISDSDFIARAKIHDIFLSKNSVKSTTTVEMISRKKGKVHKFGINSAQKSLQI